MKKSPTQKWETKPAADVKPADQLAALIGSQPVEKNWEASVGMWKDDALAREMDSLGTQWRKSVSE